MQVPEIFNKMVKNSFKLKNYTFKNDISVKVQGYEPFALEILEDMDFTSKDIITGATNVPNFEYKNNVDDRKSTYFPDIYIKKINKLIEVKSDWTFKQDIEKNLLKRKICLEKDYKFEFWIFKKKIENLIILITDDDIENYIIDNEILLTY